MSTTTGAGLEGVIAGESEICYIDGYAGVLSYRGYNIHTLADHATFEEVVYLLWNGRLPKSTELDLLKAELVANRAVPQPVLEFLAAASKAIPMDVLRRKLNLLIEDFGADPQLGPAIHDYYRLVEGLQHAPWLRLLRAAQEGELCRTLTVP